MFRYFGLLAALVLYGTTAEAEDFYVAANIGVANIDDAVDTTSTIVTNPGQLPNAFSLNGLPFDSNETSAGLVFGWVTSEWLSLELAYNDFGEAGPGLPSLIGSPIPGPIIPTTIPPSTGLFPAAFQIPPPTPISVSTSAFSFGAKFNKHLVADLSANWSLAVSYNDFDAEGAITVNEVVTVNPLTFNPVTIQFQSPDGEFGFSYGFGFEWKFNDRFSADIGYRKHDTQVLEIETITTRLTVML